MQRRDENDATGRKKAQKTSTLQWKISEEI